MNGTFLFGFVIGWLVYYTNRHRSGPTTYSDFGVLISVIAGGAVIKLFTMDDDRIDIYSFQDYGMGLAAGFFAYLLVLLLLVLRSENFTIDYFIDGRRKKMPEDQEIPDGSIGAMSNTKDDKT